MRINSSNKHLYDTIRTNILLKSCLQNGDFDYFSKKQNSEFHTLSSKHRNKCLETL